MTTQTLLRIVHIVGGVCWAGGAVFIAGLLMPSARKVGAGATPLIRELTDFKRIPMYMMIMSWSALLSGGALAWRDAGLEGMRWFEHGMGLIFGIGAAFAILGAVAGMAVTAPTAKRLREFSIQLQNAGRAPTPDEMQTMQRMQNKLYAVARVLAVLLLATTVAMASARYM
ncbi:MAG: hypothetical protein ABJB66_09790 [Gemmatimonadaceae bacterium]